MRHPAEGTLRRLLDEPAGVSHPDRHHVAGCPDCLGRLAAMREDADLVGAALATDVPDLDTATAWRRLSTGVAREGSRRAPAPRTAGARLSLLRRPVAAAVAVTVVVGGAGAAAAGGWLQIFRTEEVAPISVSTAELTALPDLEAFGDLTVTEEPDVHPVADAAAAAAQTGLDVPEVTGLPRGVGGEPAYQVGGEVSATFTFSTERAAQAAAEAGETLPTPSAGLDGSQVRLLAGPGVAQVWSSESGAPALVVGRAVAPTAESSGVPFETLRDYLLTVPGLPDSVAAQLRAFNAEGATLPLPVPADEVVTSSTEVNGAAATVLETRDRTMAAVVWVDEGVLTAVVGALGTDEVLSVARGLR